MSNSRLQQVEALEAQIIASDAKTRELLIPRLRELVSRLETEGVLPSGSTRAHMADAVDDALDDQFDNMPI